MSGLDILIVIVVALLVALAAWAYFTAQRLNRLHIRVDAALAQLQAALDRRAAVLGALDDSLRDTAKAAESISLSDGAFDARTAAERALALAAAERFPQRPEQLVEAEIRVQLAHRFYNEAVADTRALRLRPVVKACRLGGTARLPEFFELAS